MKAHQRRVRLARSGRRDDGGAESLRICPHFFAASQRSKHYFTHVRQVTCRRCQTSKLHVAYRARRTG